jgi:hypothetical protein
VESSQQGQGFFNTHAEEEERSLHSLRQQQQQKQQPLRQIKSQPSNQPNQNQQQLRQQQPEDQRYLIDPPPHQHQRQNQTNQSLQIRAIDKSDKSGHRAHALEMSDDEDPLRQRYNLQGPREQIDNSGDMKVKDVSVGSKRGRGGGREEEASVRGNAYNGRNCVDRSSFNMIDTLGRGDERIVQASDVYLRNTVTPQTNKQIHHDLVVSKERYFTPNILVLSDEQVKAGSKNMEKKFVKTVAANDDDLFDAGFL